MSWMLIWNMVCTPWKMGSSTKLRAGIPQWSTGRGKAAPGTLCPPVIEYEFASHNSWGKNCLKREGTMWGKAWGFMGEINFYNLWKALSWGWSLLINEFLALISSTSPHLEISTRNAKFQGNLCNVKKCRPKKSPPNCFSSHCLFTISFHRLIFT